MKELNPNLLLKLAVSYGEGEPLDIPVSSIIKAVLSSNHCLQSYPQADDFGHWATIMQLVLKVKNAIDDKVSILQLSTDEHKILVHCLKKGWTSKREEGISLVKDPAIYDWINTIIKLPDIKDKKK